MPPPEPFKSHIWCGYGSPFCVYKEGEWVNTWAPMGPSRPGKLSVSVPGFNGSSLNQLYLNLVTIPLLRLLLHFHSVLAAASRQYTNLRCTTTAWTRETEFIFTNSSAQCTLDYYCFCQQATTTKHIKWIVLIRRRRRRFVFLFSSSSAASSVSGSRVHCPLCPGTREVPRVRRVVQRT